MANLWSFDGHHISLLNRYSLKTQTIARPTGLTYIEWYAHAANVCKLLNHTQSDIAKAVDALLDKDAYPLCQMQDDRGLTRDEYIEFVEDVLEKL